MIKAMLSLRHDEIQREVCAALRGREALWRADPAMNGEKRHG